MLTKMLCQVNFAVFDEALCQMFVCLFVCGLSVNLSSSRWIAICDPTYFRLNDRIKSNKKDEILNHARNYLQHNSNFTVTHPKKRYFNLCSFFVYTILRSKKESIIRPYSQFHSKCDHHEFQTHWRASQTTQRCSLNNFCDQTNKSNSRKFVYRRYWGTTDYQRSKIQITCSVITRFVSFLFSPSSSFYMHIKYGAYNDHNLKQIWWKKNERTKNRNAIWALAKMVW